MILIPKMTLHVMYIGSESGRALTARTVSDDKLIVVGQPYLAHDLVELDVKHNIP